jgi:polynucleotide 5'-hydroxyl-kinase GRC3/NOL9
MNKTVEGGKTLLVDGPASAAVLSGKVEVFGFCVRDKNKIIIREGKRLPFLVLQTACFDIALGENAAAAEVEGSTIPPSWQKAFETLQEVRKTCASAMVIGGVDSGKTSLCTYLVNRLLGENRAVAILDGDVGQSDIGPPCTVAYACVAKPVTDLFALQAANAFFVGATSPSQAAARVIEGLASLKAELLGGGVDFVLVNSDGWVAGEEAVQYKARIAEALAPDVIFCVQQETELRPLIANLDLFKTVLVDSPLTINQRSREKRKSLRELGYIKYLADAKVKVWPLKRLTVVQRRALCLNPQAGAGWLLGLHNGQKKFLGIGVLKEVNCERKTLKARTSVVAEPSTIVVGAVRLDENLREVPEEFAIF